MGEAPGGVGGQGATVAGRRVGQCGRSDWTNPPVVAPRKQAQWLWAQGASSHAHPSGQ